ncbi:MAG: hypothetical protein ABIA04_01920 [Pseudomonadota bacterium]
MLDIAIAYENYKFVGYEFLTWLWYAVDNNQISMDSLLDKPFILEIGDKATLKKISENKNEVISIKGDDPNLEEGLFSLQKGSYVTELNLIYKEDDLKWQFNLKGESLNISSLKAPKTGQVYEKGEFEAATLDKIYLYERIVNLTNQLFENFLKLRTSTNWTSKTIPEIKKWLS